jgi:uncharacterized protein
MDQADQADEAVEAVQPIWRILAVTSVEVRLPDQFPLVKVVDAETGRRSLEFRIGLNEGVALRHAIDGTSAPRPMTGDLLASALRLLGAQVAAARLTGRQGSVYLAELELMTPTGRQVLECRPSDAMVLALRRDVAAPVLADERLFTPGDV